MRFLIADASGLITDVLTAPTEVEALDQLGVSAGDTLYAAPDDLPFIDDALVEVSGTGLAARSGVPGSPAGVGLTVAVIEPE